MTGDRAAKASARNDKVPKRQRADAPPFGRNAGTLTMRWLRAAGPGLGYRLPKPRRRSELATTSTELAAMAAPAIIGFRKPSAAIGMPAVL